MDTLSPLKTPENSLWDESLLTCILDMGELLLTSGAEVVRVEDTISRLCQVYQFTKCDVFTITSSIVLTVRTPSGHTLTQTRRIQYRGTNLGRIEKVNALSRLICRTPLAPSDFQRELEQLKQRNDYPKNVRCLMYVMISATFSLFFGGTLQDALSAALSGFILFQFLELTTPLHLNKTLQCILASFITSLAVAALTFFDLGQNTDQIIIGNIMLLIPGLSFTTSLRDIFNGDTLSGLLGLCEAIVRALAVAIGFATVLLWTGG